MLPTAFLRLSARPVARLVQIPASRTGGSLPSLAQPSTFLVGKHASLFRRSFLTSTICRAAATSTVKKPARKTLTPEQKAKKEAKAAEAKAKKEAKALKDKEAKAKKAEKEKLAKAKKAEKAKADKAKQAEKAKKAAAKAKEAKQAKDKKEKEKQAKAAVPIPSALKSKPTHRSSYIFYVSERMQQMKSDSQLQTTNADGSTRFDVTKASKKAGEEWKTMDASAKQPYEEKAEAERAAYGEKYESWLHSLSSEDIKRVNAYMLYRNKKTGKGRGLVLRDPTKPKKPLTAYMLFNMEAGQNDPELKGMAVIERSKQISVKWKSMSQEDKAKYEQQAAQLKEEYNAAMKNWKPQE